MAHQEKGTTQGRGQTQGNGMQGATAQDNEAIIRRMYAVLNEHDPRKVLPFLADSIQGTDVAANLNWHGHDGFSRWLTNWATAFPDYKLEVTNIVGTADKCIVEFTARGTHLGNLSSPMGNLPPTNRRVEMRFVDSHEMRNGLIVRTRTYYDAAGMLNQLGLMQTAKH